MHRTQLTNKKAVDWHGHVQNQGAAAQGALGHSHTLVGGCACFNNPLFCCTMPSACRDVLEGANELRVMLCRDKLVQSGSGQKRGTSVIAACGTLLAVLHFAVLPQPFASAVLPQQQLEAHHHDYCWGGMQ